MHQLKVFLCESGDRFWGLRAGVSVGPDGVPRNAAGDPIGARGTRVLPNGSIAGPDGKVLSAEEIAGVNVARATEAPVAPTAAAESDAKNEGCDFRFCSVLFCSVLFCCFLVQSLKRSPLR
jgi:hypothetical protein